MKRRELNKDVLKDLTGINVVFDFGNVIFEIVPFDIYKELFIEKGYTKKDLDYFLTEIFAHTQQAEGDCGNARPVLEKLAKENLKWADEIREFNADRGFIKQVKKITPEMETVLDDLQVRGANIYGLTNWAADTFETLKEAYPSVLGRFKDIVISGYEGIKKPDPDIYKRTQVRMGNPDPKKVFFFDDKEENIKAARSSVGWHADVFVNATTVKQRLIL